MFYFKQSGFPVFKMRKTSLDWSYADITTKCLSIVTLTTNKFPFVTGAPVAQWVKRWPTDLAVPSSIPARGEIFSTVNGVTLHTALHYHPAIVLI